MEEDAGVCLDFLFIHDANTGDVMAEFGGDHLPTTTPTCIPRTNIILHFHSGGMTKGSSFMMAYEIYFKFMVILM